MIDKKSVQKIIVDKKIFGNENIDVYSALNIGYIFDHGAVRGAGVSICSICENNRNKNIIFHAICTDLTKDDIDKLEQISIKYNKLIFLYFINKNVELFKNLVIGKFPVTIWYRILLPYIVNCKKILYLDADIINLSSLEKLFSIDMEDYDLLAVPDIEKTANERIKALDLTNNIYFNSGVLMINIDKWIKNNNSDKIIEIAKIYNEKLILPDQDALNILFSKSKQVYYIDRMYNRVALWKEKNIKEKLEETVLLHFVQTKPWQEAWLYEKRPYIENLYEKYEKNSPWKNMPLERKEKLSYHDKRKRAVFFLKKGKILDGLYWYKEYLKAKIMKED